jgi:hypothetical protein
MPTICKVMTAAVFLAVAGFAVCVFGSSDAAQTVAIAQGDGPATFKRTPLRQPARTPARKVGEVPAEVLAEEWVETGGGNGGGGSPKG